MREFGQSKETGVEEGGKERGDDKEKESYNRPFDTHFYKCQLKTQREQSEFTLLSPGLIFRS